MLVEIRLTDKDIDRVATRVAEMLGAVIPRAGPAWLDVRGAAAHLSLSEHALRGLVKRHQIPFHRTENGRLRFSLTELDDWVFGAASGPTKATS